MKTMSILSLIAACLVACTSQTNKNIIESINNPRLNNPVDMPRLSTANFVDTLVKIIKHYPQEPIYYFFVHYDYCVFEILLNDMPVYKQFDYGYQLGTPIYINGSVLKSGLQKVTYKLYPVGKLESGLDLSTLQEETYMEIRIKKQDMTYGDNWRESIIDIVGHISPEKVRMAGSDGKMEVKYFEGAGQDYYEHTFTFEAEVPYENEGWTNGQDLHKVDQQKLQQAVVSFYEKMWTILDIKDSNAFFSYLFLKEKETRQSLYDDKNSLEGTFATYMEAFSITSYKMQLLENYKMVFYGEGKVVALEQADETNYKFRKESAIWARYKDEEGDTIMDFTPFFLYLPEGKSLSPDNFIVIR